MESAPAPGVCFRPWSLLPPLESASALGVCICLWSLHLPLETASARGVRFCPWSLFLPAESIPAHGLFLCRTLLSSFEEHTRRTLMHCIQVFLTTVDWIANLFTCLFARSCPCLPLAPLPHSCPRSPLGRPATRTTSRSAPLLVDFALRAHGFRCLRVLSHFAVTTIQPRRVCLGIFGKTVISFSGGWISGIGHTWERHWAC